MTSMPRYLCPAFITFLRWQMGIYMVQCRWANQQFRRVVFVMGFEEEEIEPECVRGPTFEANLLDLLCGLMTWPCQRGFFWIIQLPHFTHTVLPKTKASRTWTNKSALLQLYAALTPVAQIPSSLISPAPIGGNQRVVPHVSRREVWLNHALSGPSSNHQLVKYGVPYVA